MEPITIKDPSLQFRFAAGLGDIVACTLHSKAIGWLTKRITGKDKPCTVCSKRAQAMNLLFPIPLWKLFFPSEKAMQDAWHKATTVFKNLQNTTIDSNQTLPDDLDLSIPRPETTKESDFSIPLLDAEVSKYVLISTSQNEFGNYVVRQQVFAKISN